MNTSKYTLLVLTDLSRSCEAALENAVNLSKIINGIVNVFHVIRPSDIPECENQLAAMRCIDEERIRRKQQLKSLAHTTFKNTGVHIQTNCVLGNLKDEAKTYIEKIQPDMIVLGKRTQKWFQLQKDHFTRFVLDTFNGSVLISGKEKTIQPSEKMSFGMLHTVSDAFPSGIANDLRKLSKNPVKRFYIRNSKEIVNTNAFSEKEIAYEFENSNTVMNTISDYVSKNNIELLYIQSETKNTTKRLQHITSSVKEAIHKINVPILIVKNTSSIQLQ